MPNKKNELSPVTAPHVDTWDYDQWKEANDDNRDDAADLIPYGGIDRSLGEQRVLTSESTPATSRSGGEGSRGSYADDDGTEFKFGVPEKGTPEADFLEKAMPKAREALEQASDPQNI